MLTKEQKAEALTAIKERFSRAVATVVVENRGLTAEQVFQLRRKLREAGLEFKVDKNRLVRIAVQDSPLATLGEMLIGPNGIAYSYEDPVAPARVLDELTKELGEKMVLKGGTLYDQVIPADKIKDVARMPGRQEIYAQILGGIKGPATNLVYSLTAVHQKIWGLLTAYVEKQGGAPAEN